MKNIPLIAMLALAAACVHAQTAPAKPAASAAAPMSQAEVLKVLPDAVLLKHGPIANLGMDAMTMQFGVADAKLLKAVKAGDKIRFAADKVNGKYVVTRIEQAK